MYDENDYEAMQALAEFGDPECERCGGPAALDGVCDDCFENLINHDDDDDEVYTFDAYGAYEDDEDDYYEEHWDEGGEGDV
jgi:hypothetical protein